MNTALPDPPGRAAVVFGSGGGIGAALVGALAASGDYARIHAGSRRGAGPVATRVHPFRYDLTDEASIATATQDIGEPVDLVIVASGVLHDVEHAVTPEKSFRAIDGDAMARVFAINTIGPALVAKHMLPLLPRGVHCRYSRGSPRPYRFCRH